MAGKDDKNISNARELRKYGMVMATALAAIGALLFWRGKDHHLIFFAVAALFLLTGLAIPVVLEPVHRAWMTLAHATGWVMTRVILVVTFMILLVPLGLLLRLCGKDLLDIKFDPSGSGSYWKERDLKKSGPRDYEKQF
ncbi:MAG: hypothetical protein JSW47_09290 [Phycisphaerales bacterium]|nr:MAG: hypothetical protein JSW47_09290 [Phycisphaerales bacterium]